MNFNLGLMAAALTFSASAFAQTRWDLPAAYPATNLNGTTVLNTIALMNGACVLRVHDVRRRCRRRAIRCGRW